MNRFIIHHCELVEKQRWQLIGDLIEGDASTGDSIVFEGQHFEILAITLLDELSEKVDYIGLTVAAEDLQSISGQSVEILNGANE